MENGVLQDHLHLPTAFYYVTGALHEARVLALVVGLLNPWTEIISQKTHLIKFLH